MTTGSAEAELRCPACDAVIEAGASLHGVDRLHRTGGEHEVRCCTACGTGVTLPLAAPSQIAAFYPGDYGPYDDSVGVLRGVLSHVIHRWQGRRELATLQALPPGRAVDVGCGRGDLAGLLVERGWRVTGIDPSDSACAAARLRGVDARTGTLADVELASAAYDAAIFRHSLEHSADPTSDLATVLRALRPGGLVLITVPNFGCWQRRTFGDRWFHLDLPRHRIHLTALGLRAALSRAGAAVDSLTTSTSTVGLPATVQYRLFGRCLFPSGLGLRVAVGFCVLCVPAAWILDRAHGGGDQLHAVALRPA